MNNMTVMPKYWLNKSKNNFVRPGSMENNTENTTEVSKAESGLSLFVEILKVIVLALMIIIPVRTFLFQPFFVQGASMEPNFHDGEYLIINELGYKETRIGVKNSELVAVEPFKQLQRGDVVVFRYPRDPEQFFIKRVIGLPNERIDIKNGNVTIFNSDNPEGMVLDEKEYLSNLEFTRGESTYTLKEDEYWVLGDNRAHSSDSRTWGPVPEENIIGKVLLRAWPVGKFEVFSD